MKKYPVPVTYARVKLAVMANCRAGGYRLEEMKKFVLENNKKRSKNVEKDALILAAKGLTNTNAWRVLRWLKAIGKGEDCCTPHCFSNQLKH